MAELAVSAALVLLEIAEPLLSKVILQVDLREIQSMESWLRYMKALMEDHPDLKTSRRLEDQVYKVRDIAYDIEDVLEEFMLHSPPYLFHNHGISRTVHNILHQAYHGFPLNAISEKISRIKRSIDDVRSQQRFFASAGSSSNSRNRGPHPPASPLLLDDEMVGYDNEKMIFARQLVDGEKRLLTLAVVGPGGSGKTAFVKNVFWKRGIMGRFDCHAWVQVSQNFQKEEAFVNMLRQLCGSRKEPYPIDDGTNTEAKLRKYLTGKRFIVVLDDIWRKEVWDVIKYVLPDSFCGSRIIVTTRSSDVASVCASSSPLVHELKELEWLQGWTLFCRKAFPERNGECPSELKDCSKRIVTRCEGLPLAIVTVGGALSQIPRLPNEWKSFHDSIGCETRDGSSLSVISNALLPGYMDLSSNLKCCFLYFSVFPEDYSVERGRLIRLWVAEQFAVRTDSKTAEEVAEGYLKELIQRNLVHVSNRDFDGKPRNCRVLNPVLNFIIHKCKDENFASIFPRESTSRNQKIRRLSVHDSCTHLPRDIGFSGVRSMFLLRLLEISTPNFEKVLRELKLVRVLDFQGAPIQEVPKDITRLTLLKHLSFRGTKINTIPSSIEKLSYLETLDLKQTDVTELPKEISHLHNLRHLFAYKYNVDDYVAFDSVQGVKMPHGIGNLTNLQNLSLMKVGKKVRILEELKSLTKLRKLGLTGLRRGHGKELFTSIEHMPELRTLDLCSNTKEEFLELGEMRRRPPLSLERLYLKGRLKQFPSWISSLHNLLRIGLKWSKMQRSPLRDLQELKNLVELQLVDCYIGGELIFEASSFKKLKVLLIEDFAELHTIVVQNGAMPDVKQISLRRCPRVTIVPLGMENLAKVEELTLYDMAQGFTARVRKNGIDRAMVTHIPVIHSFTLRNRSWSFENLSDSFLR
ncbi:PREDICTED: disease resistance protein RPM1-like isoform X1 [Erythranthe guttata]|nr:PREDICTED: disease resistance protein RPM1-like isoform X1 [Erythranthe guttata]|eukprot:XP_012849297.1 PREDICTED: disease resistance protein RPM1-like isoform X1 [Erythranthe guttata]